MGRTQRLRGRIKKVSSPNDADDAKQVVGRLFKQLATLGWKNETQLTVKQFAVTGRGLCSKTKTIAIEDDLIRLPLKALITIATLECDLGFRTQFCSDKFDKDKRMPFQCLLAWYLLYHRHLKERSPWYAYLCSLPEYFTTPYFCDKSELNQLPVIILENTVLHTQKIRAGLTNFSLVLATENCDCCGEKLTEIYSSTAFKWAYFVINTRSVYFYSSLVKPDKYFFQPLLSDDTNLALAPFLDLFNHSDAVTTSAALERNSSKQWEYVIKLQTVQHDPSIVKPYEQLFISYGSSNNLKLLLDYGFVLPNNTHDYFELTMLDIENFIHHHKLKFGALNMHRNKFKFIREHNLTEQLFVHHTEGLSHNLHVVLHVLFKERAHFPNVLNAVAFGDAAHLANVSEEARLLIAYKIADYQCYIDALKRWPHPLSKSGHAALDFMQEGVHYLTRYLNES